MKTLARIRREYRTMQAMVMIYCRGNHQRATSHPCADCEEFLAYASQRLDKCPYGEDKPTCANCPVHCYKQARREQAREIMRYAGPRVSVRHPWLALRHSLDSFRRVEHPLKWRKKKRNKNNI
jgi:hypothetical protein